MNLTVLLGVGLLQWALLAAIMAAAWIIQQRTKNSGFVDAVWTFGVGIVGVLSALVPLGASDAASGRQILVASAVAAWSLRLGSHILRRSLSRADDPRYAALIRSWGRHAGRQMFLLLQKQVIVSLPLVLGIFVAAHNPAPGLRVQDLAAIAVVLIGFVGEAIADRQLRTWASQKEEGKGVVCDRGLWRWSRHPNYFFEWVFWLALPLFAVDWGSGYPFGWLALGAPACMFWLLVYVSGIPPLEEHMLNKHGDAYRRYQEITSPFLPLPPRRRVS